MPAKAAPAFCPRPRPFLGLPSGTSPASLRWGTSCARLGEPFEWVSGLVSSKQHHPLEDPALALFLFLPSPKGKEFGEPRRCAHPEPVPTT